MLLLIAVSTSSVFAYSSGPPDGLTGAPGEGNCTQCHAGNSLNAAGGSLMLTVPEVYTPGEMYEIIVNLSRSGQSRWGFEMTALNDNGARAGTLAKSDGNTQVTEANSKQYIKQTTPGSAAGTRDRNQWTFNWTAPNNDVGQITFYAAGNAANNADFTTGDYIYTQLATSDAVTYGVSLAGIGELRKTVNTGVETSYTLRVTNIGNIDDTIDLTTSGLTSARLDRTSVPLAAGASTNVTLTIPGTALSTAGNYVVTVKASSQKDSTKTDEVTTTTTVLPVYGVTLVGVGGLEKTVNTGVATSYTLRVTNIGNTDDTLRLTTSGDTTATLSRTTIPLGAGATSDVSVTISDTSLSRSGTYKVKVTATSQKDSSITDEITTTTTILPAYRITLIGKGELTTETSDASEGVTYTLTITNNGNTDDVIDLETSGTDATLSQNEVSLAAGASAEVMLTISGDVLTTAGTYEVKITATSQGDDTQASEVSTTTTILPVYGVLLEVEGELAKDTAMIRRGVSYGIKITNTGNTDDTIDLSASGDVIVDLRVDYISLEDGSPYLFVDYYIEDPPNPNAVASKKSVPLPAGATAEVRLGVFSDLPLKAGDYEVKVTATSQGDGEKTAEVITTTTILPVYGITLAGVGELTTETTDASEGVSYTIEITNNGNTEDVIDLETSDTAATLSQSEVSLDAGASAEVMLTIAGDVLVTAGVYVVNVTATSQVDNANTAIITTKTTILPVYGVMLAGEGELKGATMDMLTGVTYTLTVTNTGNTDDTIVLSSSAEFGIEGTFLGSFDQSEVMLTPGISTNVIFTAAGDFFTKPGDYEIIVTATSLGDSTKTAEITITTTIEPVPWDLNGDGIVNILDLVLVANQFGESGDNLSGDVNMDGKVNILDLVAVANQFGKTQAEIVQANQ